MQTFEFSRPADTAAAVATAAKAKTAQQGADVRFVAGGTTLLDLMKLNVETPAQVLDINRLPLDKVEAAADGGLKIGATVRNSDLAHHPTVQKRLLRCCRKRCWPGRRHNCGTWRRRRAICCSGRGACISATRRCRATSGSRGADAPRSPAATARWRCWGRANIVSRRIRRICAWRWRRSRRRFMCKGRPESGRFRLRSFICCRERRPSGKRCWSRAT